MLPGWHATSCCDPCVHPLLISVSGTHDGLVIQEYAAMPKIDVFLMFGPSDRSFIDKKDPESKKKIRTKIAPPNWKSIGVELRRKGYELTVYGPSINPAVQDIQDSMSNAEVTLLVGHGAVTPSAAGGSKWITDQIKLKDGFLRSPDGVFTGKWNGGKLEEPKNSGKLKINKVTGVFTCNSTDKMPDAFDLQPGSHLITNDGGEDGLTRVGTLEWGAAEFVLEYVRKKGNVSKAMNKAQVKFKERGEKYKGDADDLLSDKIGPEPPPPAPVAQPPSKGP